MEKLSHQVYNYLISCGATEELATYGNMTILLIILFISLYIIDIVLRKIIIATFTKFAEKSKTAFDDLLIQNKVPRNIAHITPVIIADTSLAYIFIDFPKTAHLLDVTLQIVAVFLTLWIIRSLLNTIKDFFKTIPKYKDKPIDSFIQVFLIIAWIIGIITAVSIITETPIWQSLTAFGAASAVVLLIFKDTILGFVASIQVSINDMVHIGDWITFEKYGADGNVIEINLATVKVQNFDKTITTIPTYALISDSFKNWRGMKNSDGRRIKRAVLIKQESIRFLTDDNISKLSKIALITDYLKNRQEAIDKHNTSSNIDKSLLLNGRNQTNLGVFRKYIDSYISSHSGINKEMMIMCRQLSPTSQGIPIEIYAFSSDKRWENYEYIMADIFDHILASVTYFDLELYELPSHSSFKS